MSSIFEALQRSEAERLGIATEKLTLVTDLLQAAESKVPRKAPQVGFIDLGQCRSLSVSPLHRIADSCVSLRTKA